MALVVRLFPSLIALKSRGTMLIPKSSELIVRRYYDVSIEQRKGASLNACEVYEDYCAWCEVTGMINMQSAEPALPS